MKRSYSERCGLSLTLSGWDTRTKLAWISSRTAEPEEGSRGLRWAGTSVCSSLMQNKSFTNLQCGKQFQAAVQKLFFENYIFCSETHPVTKVFPLINLTRLTELPQPARPDFILDEDRWAQRRLTQSVIYSEQAPNSRALNHTSKKAVSFLLWLSRKPLFLSTV